MYRGDGHETILCKILNKINKILPLIRCRFHIKVTEVSRCHRGRVTSTRRGFFPPQ